MSELKGAKYPSGIFLLYPEPGESQDGVVKRERDCSVDIIFVHGVTGDPKGTWRYGPEMPDPAQYVPRNDISLHAIREGCWASDWIPEDFPSSRVLSIGYEVRMWSTKTKVW